MAPLRGCGRQFIQFYRGESHMAESDHQSEEPLPFMQRVLDNPFLLLFLGIAMPAALYLVWGLYEILQIPAAK